MPQYIYIYINHGQNNMICHENKRSATLSRPPNNPPMLVAIKLELEQLPSLERWHLKSSGTPLNKAEPLKLVTANLNLEDH